MRTHNDNETKSNNNAVGMGSFNPNVGIPSEVKWGVPKQPEPTCPLINDALNDLEKSLKELNVWGKTEDVDELRNKCDMAYLYIQSVSVKLEKIRDRASEIRAWGDAWKSLAKKHAPMKEEYVSQKQPH